MTIVCNIYHITYVSNFKGGYYVDKLTPAQLIIPSVR